jgi:hypothetical protein
LGLQEGEEDGQSTGIRVCSKVRTLKLKLRRD